MQHKILLIFFFIPFSLFSRLIDTFYGPIEVTEPVLLELIDSSTFQRLKSIHQYGVSYYTTHNEEYNRYDHSIGVFTILRIKGASLEEQIAGLLHDVSHTAFSHVGDWVFGKENQEKDYQNDIHANFLEISGLGDILRKYNFTIDQVLPIESLFPALENSLPNLSADRIDYNIQGAYHRNFISYDEALSILNDIRYVDSRWVSTEKELMVKLSRYSYFMSLDCWGSPTNYMMSRWLADAILRAIELKIISYEDLHFGTDQVIWDILLADGDPFIKRQMEMIFHPDLYLSIFDSSQGDFTIKTKFRGIDPWIQIENSYVRLSELLPTLAEEYEKGKQKAFEGWGIKIENISP